VVCGWIADVNQWDGFEVDWKLFLIKNGVPYFHMKEFSHSVGPFAKWRGNETVRKQFSEDAWDIIRSRTRHGFVCSVQDVLFNIINRSYRLTETFPSCYALAGRECMDWANAYAHAAHHEVKCIFDDGAPGKSSLRRVAGLGPILPSPQFEPSRDIQDRKKGLRRGFVQIQAADFLAYEVRKYWIDHPLYRTGQRSPRMSLRQFGQRQPETKFMNERRMFTACQKFGIERRNTNG
jgi:hypothetical protein